MDTQAATQVKEAHDKWTVDDVVRAIRTDDGATHHARRWVAVLGALAIAAAATVGTSADHAAVTPKPAALPARIAAAAAARPAVQRVLPATVAGHGPMSSRSLVIVMPADRDYLAATGIPVAGIALARPHGPRVRAVRVELFVAGRLVEGMDLGVYAGRFAGVLALDEPIARADAEIRLSNPANPAQAAAVRSITIDTPSTTR